ncbi:Hypothetical protein NTJ_06352 [Nesidiocoris tenuis]|uniref:Uncharacterized protein n=1 Tax=Nesidiocoris tenuis TaxID=355587 RepID=A0ABN7ANA1_9HEMI|nr:Hypothetical protein NTJ_06352 [Nesidiocoris tenuis]
MRASLHVSRESSPAVPRLSFEKNEKTPRLVRVPGGVSIRNYNLARTAVPERIAWDNFAPFDQMFDKRKEPPTEREAPGSRSIREAERL